MEENIKKTPEVIDLRVVFKKIWDNRRLFYKVLPIVFVLSCIYIFSLPRYYRSDTRLAPEMENSGAGGALSSIASSFGFDLSEMQTTDAITPLLYPDLMEDNGFVSNLLGIKVASQDGEINATYHDYLKLYQKKTWWSYPIDWLKSLLPKKEDKGGSKNGYDPYNVSRNEDDIMSKARSNIGISIDKKTGVISIDVEAQDPLICKTLADSIKDKLQVFITDYRTNKARTDYEYYKQLTETAKRDYEKARQQYGSMSDANSKVSLRSVELIMEDMENDMQLKFNAYTTVNNQLQAAKAKVQEKTPAFTVLKGAAVPIKPAGPKRMIFVAAMLILTCIVLSLYSIRGYIFNE
mgnify:CR=1 FL=1